MSSFISEGAIFQEAELISNKNNKAICRMTLQTADDVNQNKRLYPHSVLDEGIKACKPRMERKAFFGELDHPIPQNNEAFDQVRQTTIMLKEVGHIIRDTEWRGNHLVGELETTSTPNGYIMAGLLRDKSGLGVSMRGLASLKRESEYNLVEGPLTIIGFDSVSLPSHKAAVVDFNEMRFESNKILSESIIENKSTICTPDGRCYLIDYFDKLVESKVIKFFDRWI